MLRLFLLLIFVSSLNASIDCCDNDESILQESQIYLDKENLSFQEMQKYAQFSPNASAHLNLGFLKDSTLWIRLEFKNKSASKLTKVLEIQNPLLESVRLYKAGSLNQEIFPWQQHKSINSAFVLHFTAHEKGLYFLKVRNDTTALRLGISLKSQMDFIYEDHKQQMIIFIFMSILSILFLYNFILYMYTKERAYLYYSLYLGTLMFQQSTYLGITQMFLPNWFLHYDNLGVVFKVNIMYIAAALFAKEFLLTKNYPYIERVYNLIIIAALIEMPLFGFSWFYIPEVAILTGFFFVIFNIFAAIYIYRDGYKQARLFVIGWSFLVIGFSLMIIDGLGLFSIMHKMPNIILVLTAFEALVLSLAFTDRYMILKEQKERSDTLLVNTLKERHKVIEFEIQKQTKALNHALENKRVLLKELHHRTKNNLQLILSLVRMQSDNENDAIKNYSKNLENRINSIARMHQMLYLNDDLQQINMDEYMEELSGDLENLSKKDVLINIEDRQVYLPFKEAGYLGLILNELITNSIKYVTLSHIAITIELIKVSDGYRLFYKDNGFCYDFFKDYSSSIGLKLIKTLVEEQLEGSISVKKKNGCKHIIEFKI